MTPRHQHFDHHEVEDHDNADFMPLEHRRWSDASDVSAYCIHPDDHALRKHPYRALHPKKVAVIGTNTRSIICASTLKQDGHEITVLASTSQMADVDTSEHQCHPDFSSNEHQSPNANGSNYLQACAIHFGVTIKFNTRVTEMSKKYEGWVLTYHDVDTNHQNDEYFDFVVIADLMEESSSRPPTCRFYEQLLLPTIVLGLIWVRELLRRVWNVAISRTTPEQPPANQTNSHMMTPSYEHLPALYQIRSNPSLYRRMISPAIPRVVVLEQPVGSSAYLASIWLSTLLYDEMDVPVDKISGNGSNRRLQSTLKYNDLLLRDLGMSHLRKKTLWQEFFSPYTSLDYRGILHQIQERRRISRQEGWAVPLTPLLGCE
jgi:hypothetical protein